MKTPSSWGRDELSLAAMIVDMARTGVFLHSQGPVDSTHPLPHYKRLRPTQNRPPHQGTCFIIE